jgi:hypothetical protein
VERAIGSIRRESLDHVIVFSEASLRRTLASYFSYYHETRPIFRYQWTHRSHGLSNRSFGQWSRSLSILGTPDRIARGSLCAFRIHDV